MSLRASRKTCVVIYKSKGKDIDCHANANAFARNDEAWWIITRILTDSLAMTIGVDYHEFANANYHNDEFLDCFVVAKATASQ